MKRLDEIAREDEKGRLRAVLESPQGSRHKFKYESSSGTFSVSTTFPAGMSMPFDFGFFPRTRSGGRRSARRPGVDGWAGPSGRDRADPSPGSDRG